MGLLRLIVALLKIPARGLCVVRMRVLWINDQCVRVVGLGRSERVDTDEQVGEALVVLRHMY